MQVLARAIVGLVLVVGVSAASSVEVRADDDDERACIGELTGTLNDNEIVVPSNEECIIKATTVRGDVSVKRNGRLTIMASTVEGNASGGEGARLLIDASDVKKNVSVQKSNGRLEIKDSYARGNVSSNGAILFTIDASDVGGDVSAVDGVDFRLTKSAVSGGVRVREYSGAELKVSASTIVEDLRVERSASGTFEIADTRVNHDVHLLDNKGPISLKANGIDGRLRCQDNSPAPTGEKNRANFKEGQCSALP